MRLDPTNPIQPWEPRNLYKGGDAGGRKIADGARMSPRRALIASNPSNPMLAGFAMAMKQRNRQEKRKSMVGVQPPADQASVLNRPAQPGAVANRNVLGG
jgi:hypothetical protein